VRTCSRLALALLLAAGAARADFFNARNVLIGERAATMGGAFTALADDGSAAYYNPAGLSQLPGFTATVAADAYALYLLHRVEVLNGNGDRLGLSFIQPASIPTTFGATYSFRPGLVAGLHAFTGDLFRVSAIATRQDTALEVPMAGTLQSFSGVSLRAKLELQSALMGPSLGWDVGHGFSVGAALFYHLAQSTVSLATEYFTPGGEHAMVQQANEVLSGGLVPSLGVLYRAPLGLRFGLSWQCQTLPLHGTNDWSSSAVSTGLGESFAAGRVRGEVRNPHRFALGLAWDRPGVLTLSADVVVYAGLDYPAPHEPLRADLADNRHRELAHVDGSLGAEVPLNSRWALRAGLFTNTSSASQQFIEERVQLFGATLGVGFRTGNLETGLGLVGQFGGSSPQAERPDLPPTSWSRAQVMLVLGGSHRVFAPEPSN